MERVGQSPGKCLTFQFKQKEYSGASALDVVRALERDAQHYPHRGQSIRKFLRWSLEDLGDDLPPRDLDLSDRLGDDELALSYLYLCDEYGVGEILVVEEPAELNRRFFESSPPRQV